MTEPQAWTLIGVFAASVFTMMGLISTMFTRVLRAEIGGLRGEMRAEIGGLRSEIRAEFTAVRAEIGTARQETGSLRAEMNTKFEAVGHQFTPVHRALEGLDRDVQALTKRVFNRPD